VVHDRISEQQLEVCTADLQDLAYNLWWSWNPDAQEIFHQLSPFFWEHSHHNPVEVLNWVSGQELRGRLEQAELRAKVQKVCSRFKAYVNTPETWVSANAPSLHQGLVAYFSAEFGLHECLHVYSGGLGILAGDHAKSASDLGLPFVGVSLFYRQGYFQQQISDDGWQQERYPAADPLRLPIRLVTGKDGSPLVSSVEIDHATVAFRAWVVNVGRARVYLLDSNLPQNEQRFRDLTAHVYGGDQTNRIGQELLLGIGGVRLLRALGLNPTVFHMNEGHAAFLTLELLREQIAQNRQLADAEWFVKSACVFTTHTPVPAGHDRFDRGLMDANLRSFAGSLNMTVEQVMRYGRINQDDPNETFTMTVLALRFSRSANGVSELHGKTSADMWKELYPGVPVGEVPIGHITNGVHVTGWTAPTAGAFWTMHLGEQWDSNLQDREFWERGLDPRNVLDADLWQLRNRLRRELIEFVRKRLREQHLRNKGFDPGIFESVLAPDVLTIGFARRFATYKRAPLFFRDLNWARRMLNDPERRVQIVFAGKAHPRDDAGKHFIQQIVDYSKQEDLFGKVVFIENYDIDVARHLVAGADVWLNTPRRPMEASGTSGEKALIHGGLHLSTMDGWWREAYDGNNGWKIGEDAPSENETVQDDRDAASLRAVIEREVVPLFYDRGRDGIPHAWLGRVRHSMKNLIPFYNTERMVTEYITRYYLQHERASAKQQV
jgi:glycogen phosphorylase